MISYNKKLIFFTLAIFSVVGCKSNNEEVENPVTINNAKITSAYINSTQFVSAQTIYELPSDSVIFHLSFLDPLQNL